MSSYSEPECAEGQWWDDGGPINDDSMPVSSKSSPAQQVPQNGCILTDLLRDTGIHSESTEGPALKIIEQPQNMYKFRYLSEMRNSHGCLYGISYINQKKSEKTYPAVELSNYHGKAVIKCQLVQFDNPFEHPHKLYVNGEDVIGVIVPQDKNYKVRFPGLCIVHTLSNDVASWLFRGHNTDNLTTEERASVYAKCETMAKLINLNIVRLKFSAVDPDSNEEICSPAFSVPIRHLTNPTTNILKICRMSRSYGSACGHDDVIMLVEKVLKKKIAIRFYEWHQPTQTEPWSAYGTFSESDVHHQYAISFRTPPYKDQNITSRVKVYVELIRTSNGEKSEPVEFFYTPNPYYQYAKRRKISTYGNNSQCTPVSIDAGNEVEAATGIVLPQPVSPQVMGNHQSLTPQVVENLQILQQPLSPRVLEQSLISQTSSNQNISQVLQQPATYQVSGNQQILLQPVASGSQPNNDEIILVDKSPMLAQNNHMLEATTLLSVPEGLDIVEFDNIDFTEYFDYLLEHLGEPNLDHPFQEGSLTSDFVGRKNTNDKDAVSKVDSVGTKEDQTKLEKMVKEIQSMVKTKEVLKNKLTKTIEELFEIRLSNGDTFLHVVLSSKHPLLKYIINLISDANFTHLLNQRNAALQTILHLAIANKQLDIITFLISKGSDPMLEDLDGNNAFHYAVMFDAGLDPLLNAVEEYQVSHDLEAYNNERQTPLHLAAVHGSASSALRLLRRGARRDARDAARRTPLHLAALDHAPPVLHALLRYTPQEDIDEVDGHGYTALHILCEQPTRETTYNLVWQLLVEKQADPNLKIKGNITAWTLVKDKEIRFDMRKWLNLNVPAENVAEDEFQSAEEGEDDSDCPCFSTDTINRKRPMVKEGPAASKVHSFEQDPLNLGSLKLS